MFILLASELCLTSECSYVWWFLLLDISNIRDMSCHQTMHDLIHLEIKEEIFSNLHCYSYTIVLTSDESRAVWPISGLSRSLNQAFMEPWMFTRHWACGTECRNILPIKTNSYIRFLDFTMNEKFPHLEILVFCIKSSEWRFKEGSNLQMTSPMEQIKSYLCGASLRENWIDQCCVAIDPGV